MPISARTARIALACFALACAILLSSCTIVRHGETVTSANAAAKTAAANESFDAKAYVTKNWAGKIEPELVRDATDLREIVGALRKDPEAAERKYGKRKDETALYNFAVKGEERVVSVFTESSAGYLELDFADGSGQEKVRLQIGPVIKSTAVRDVLPFINFGDFVNQLDFANISREINFYVRDHIVAGLDKATLVGKRLSFVGAFSEDSAGKVLITPVKIGVEK